MFNPNGALLQQKAFFQTTFPGSVAGPESVAYIASLDRIAIDWNGPGVYLYDPATLTPTASVLGSIGTGFHAAFYTANNNRFIAMGVQGSGSLVLFEHDATLATNTQKYIYATGALPQVISWDRYCVDQFGGVWCLSIDTGATPANRGAYMMNLSASAGGFIPLRVVQIGVIGDPLSAPSPVYWRIQVKPDGDILVLWAGVANETMYCQVWTVAADLTVARSRVVATLTRAGGAETQPRTGGEFTFSADYKRMVISSPRVSPLVVPLDLPVNNEISLTSASHGTVRVYAETMNRAAASRPDLLPARSVNGNTVAPSVATSFAAAPVMADLTARYTWNALGQCQTYLPPVP
jgi:hypothetical protein